MTKCQVCKFRGAFPHRGPLPLGPVCVPGAAPREGGGGAGEGEGPPALFPRPRLPAERELRMRPGLVGEGLGGGGGEGDFSPAAAAFQRDSARPRGRGAGAAERGRSLRLARPGPSPGNPNSGWESIGNYWDPRAPYKDTPLLRPDRGPGRGPPGRGSGGPGVVRWGAGKCQTGGCASGGQGINGELCPPSSQSSGPGSGSSSLAESGLGTALDRALWSSGGASHRGLGLPRSPGLSGLRVHEAELGLPWQRCAWLKLRRCRFSVLNPLSVQIFSVLGTLPRLEFGLASPTWMEVIYSFIQQIFTEYSFWLACDRCLDVVNKEETDRFSAKASFRK